MKCTGCWKWIVQKTDHGLYLFTGTTYFWHYGNFNTADIAQGRSSKTGKENCDYQENRLWHSSNGYYLWYYPYHKLKVMEKITRVERMSIFLHNQQLFTFNKNWHCFFSIKYVTRSWTGEIPKEKSEK